MRIIVLFLLVIEYSIATSLYEEWKADVKKSKDKVEICENVSIVTLIQQKDTQLLKTKKIIWETTEEFQKRKKALQKKLESEIVQAIHTEISSDGAGEAKMQEYNADTGIMKLSLKWGEQIKKVFSHKKLDTKIAFYIHRQKARKIFEEQPIHPFYITTNYTNGKLNITQMYLKDGKHQYTMRKQGWITPTTLKCQSQSGEMVDGVCRANWENAKKICQTLHARLPTKEELYHVVTICSRDNTTGSKQYHTCYKNKGFTSYRYWSSTTRAGYSSNAWVVYFRHGYQGIYDKSRSFYVRCVRAGQ